MRPEPRSINIPASEALALPAHRLSCRIWGKSDAPAVMCVHGLTRNAHDFDFLAEALADDFYVICPDLPGRGDSEWLADPAGYNYATYAADLSFLIGALKLTRVHWVGTSLGGILGMMMAAQPGLLASLALNDIGAVIARAGLQRIAEYAGVKMAFKSRTEAEAELRRIAAPFGINDEAHWRHFLDHSIVEAEGGARFSYDPAIMAGFPKEKIEDIDLWGLWEPVTKIPTLLIRGEKSDILLRETALAMQARHPRLELYEVAGAGHAPALMDEKQVAKVKEWLLRN